MLRRVADEVRAGGHRAVFVVGEAGIGKTAFIETFLSQLARNEPRLWVASATCVRLFGGGEPYLPVLEALRGLCRGVHGAPQFDLLKQVAPSWAVQLPELLSGSELRELGRNTATAATRCRLLSEMGAFFEKLASDRGLMWCIEDLHWADPWTLELLAYLTRRSDLSRSLILATLRPPEESESISILAELCGDVWGPRFSETVQLQPLTSEQVSQYLDVRYSDHDFPKPLAGLAYERTLGTPLFVVQWANALLDAGLVQRNAGTWRLAVEMEWVRSYVPESTARTIEMQVASLALREQNLLDAASVCGPRFAVNALAEMVHQDVVEVERSCHQWARQNRFLRLVGEAAWPDGSKTTIFALTHALYQDVLYRRLGVATRTCLHRRLGESLERAYGARSGEIAAELALHFERASDPARAARYLRMVAETPLAHRAYLETTQSRRTEEWRGKTHRTLEVCFSSELPAFDGSSKSYESRRTLTPLR